MSHPNKGSCSNVKNGSASQNFGRNRRLLDSAQFKRVFESNDKVGDRFWTMLYRTNDSSGARLGMAVAKKRAKRAVDRSRLRRLVRESFRLQNLPSVDIVVMPKDVSVTATNQDLLTSLNKQWSRIAERCAKQCPPS